MVAQRVAVAAVLLLVHPSIAGAAEYVVSPTGSDMNSGSALAPWKTLQRAADAVGPGDHVTVRAGAYAGFQLETSGTSTMPIEFVAEPGVLVNQPNPIRPEHGINLENASHVIVDGFAVTGMEEAGVRTVGVDGDEFAEFVTIRNVHSYNNGYWGILTGFVDDLLIENNETFGSAIEHGIYVSNSGDRPIVRNNVIWGNDRNGIHMNGDVTLGGDGIITGAMIYGNVIYDNGDDGGSGINMDGVQDSRIENNLLYNNHASGISLYRIDGGGGSTGNVVVNNTIHQADDGLWALNIQDGSTGNTARNNILISEHSFRGAIDISQSSLAGFSSDYNLVISRFTTDGGDSTQTLNQWRAATGNDVHSLIATAGQLFENQAAGDYHLLSTAEAINAGTSFEAPTVDIEGLSRPVGSTFDIGAYEWQAAALTGDYNGNGVVDAADFTVWRDTLGSTTNLGADGNGSHEIDAGDFAVWRQNLGATSGMGVGGDLAVPEPATASMLVATISVALFVIKRTFISPAARSPRPDFGELSRDAETT